MFVNPHSCPSSESPLPTFSCNPIAPLLRDEIPTISVNPLTVKRALRRELEPFLSANGRIEHGIPFELPPLSEEQCQCIAALIFNLEGSLNFLKGRIKGRFVPQWVGGGVRDIFYKDLSYLHAVLTLLKIPQPERYHSLLKDFALREVPDTDIRIWLEKQDAGDMGAWPQDLSLYRKVSWHKYHCSVDADYAIAICPVSHEHPKDEFLFTQRLARVSLFKHDLMVEINVPLMEGLKFAIPRSLEDSSKQELDLNELWQAAFDLLTRRLHVDRPEEVNFEGLPILISYYVRGWTLGDAEVEPIFLKKFLKRAESEGGIVKNFIVHFQKTWKKHHFSDPEAALALAFNFCAAAKGMEGVNDTDLLSIMREVYNWFPGKNPQGHNVLSGIKDFVFKDDCTLESLFDSVYTQGILSNTNPALLDHLNGEAFQVEFRGAHELLHLLIPKQFCHISFKGSEKTFFQMIPNLMQTEELGVLPDPLWDQADALWSVEKKSRSQVNRGCGAMILSQLLQPDTEKERVLLRRLPLMMAAQSNEGIRFDLLLSLQKALGKNYLNLLQQSEQHLKEPFEGGRFVFEWIKILAQRVEGPLRNISWDLWNSQAPKRGKVREKKELELFELYFSLDVEKSLRLFSCFSPSLPIQERLKYWRRLCESLELLEAPMEDLARALENIGKIPPGSTIDQRFYTVNVMFFRSLMEGHKVECIYPLMKQAVSSGLLHSSSKDLMKVWFELCGKLLPFSPENAYEALEIGTKKSFFITPSVELLEFKMELAEALHRIGSYESATALIQSIRKQPEFARKVKDRLLAIEGDEFHKQFEGLELKKPEAVALVLRSWLKRAEKGVVDLKATTSLIIYYNKIQDYEILTSIVCHNATAKLVKLNPKVFSGPLIDLVQRCGNLKKGMIVIKAFFDFFEAFEKHQQKVGLVAAYEHLSEKGESLVKLPGSIKNSMVKNATLLMGSSPKPLSCLYFLKEIDCQFRPDLEAWALLAADAAAEENRRELYKIILEFKSANAPPACLEALVQKLLENPGSQTINQIRTFLSWEKPSLNEDLSKTFLRFLHNLDLKKKVQVAVSDKDLLRRLIPKEELKQLVYELSYDALTENIEEVMILGGEYGFMKASLLKSFLEKVVESDQRHLKSKARDLCCKAFHETFELEGESTIKAQCWSGYLNLCTELGDRGMIRFLQQSINKNSPFSAVLESLDPEFKVQILCPLVMSVLARLTTEQEFQESISIIEQAISPCKPPQEWIESVISVYLDHSSPEILLCALRHLTKLQCINNPKIFSAVFTCFASIADQEHPARAAIHLLVRDVYEIAEADPRFSEQIPFASAIFEAVSKFHSKLLIDLADRLLLMVSKQSEWDVALQQSIRDFVLSLLKSEDPERQRLAEGLIRVERFDRLLERELRAELRFNMVQLKINRELEVPTGLITLNMLLHECLDSFEYVLRTNYQLRIAQNFMTLLAKLNAASPNSDGYAFNNYLEAYAKCFIFSYTDQPLKINQQLLNVLELFLKCTEAELIMYPNLEEKVLLPSQVFVLESAKLGFICHKNRTETVEFIVAWLQSFIRLSIGLGSERRSTIEAHMIYAIMFWTKGLFLLQVKDHVKRVHDLLFFGIQNKSFNHQHDLLAKSMFMLIPIQYIPKLEIIDGQLDASNLNETPEILCLDPIRLFTDFLPRELPEITAPTLNQLPRLFSQFIIKLTKLLEPTSFFLAILAMNDYQNEIFRDRPQEYNRLMSEVFKHYAACHLQCPNWGITTGKDDKMGEPPCRGSAIIPVTDLLIRNRLHELGIIYGIDALEYSYPLASDFLRMKIALCEDLSRNFDLETSCFHSLNTGTLLSGQGMWTCFIKHPNEYWQLVDLWVKCTIELLQNPKIERSSGIKICLMFLELFADLGGFCTAPFSGIKLDKKTQEIKVGIQLKALPAIVEYYKSMLIPDEKFEVYLKLFKQLAPSSILLDGMTPRQKKHFLEVFHR